MIIVIVMITLLCNNRMQETHCRPSLLTTYLHVISYNSYLCGKLKVLYVCVCKWPHIIVLRNYHFFWYLKNLFTELYISTYMI